MPIALALLLAALQAAPRTDAVVPPGGQVDGKSSANVGAAQVVTTRRSGAVEQLPRSAVTRPMVTQVTPAREARAPQSQITRERPGVGTPQLGQPARSATAPASAASRADGRRTEVVRVGGSDRCASANVSTDPACARVIETRSAEFTAPQAPVLSPEQRLLLNQDRGETRGVRAASQRVARNDVDPDALDTQALAAITLAQQTDTTTPTPTEQQLPTGTQALVVQIIQAVQAGAPK